MSISSTSNLQNKESRKKERITDASQIAQLPANQHVVMEILLTSREMSYSHLCEAIKHLPDDKRLSQSQIDSTLYELISIGYLTSFMEDGEIIYMMQLKGNQQKRDEQRLWDSMSREDLLRQLKNKKKKD